MVLDEMLGDFESMETDSKQAIELFPAEPYSYLLVQVQTDRKTFQGSDRNDQ